MDEKLQVGAESTCTMCGAAIVFVDPYWDHVGNHKPRHPATPGPGPAPAPPQWMAQLDERTNKHIVFALHYAERFAHGAPGHLDLMTIAALANFLNNYEDHGSPWPQ